MGLIWDYLQWIFFIDRNIFWKKWGGPWTSTRQCVGRWKHAPITPSSLSTWQWRWWSIWSSFNKYFSTLLKLTSPTDCLGVFLPSGALDYINTFLFNLFKRTKTQGEAATRALTDSGPHWWRSDCGAWYTSLEVRPAWWWRH